MIDSFFLICYSLVSASNQASQDPVGAKCMGKASIAMSVSGICIAILVVSLAVSLTVSAEKKVCDTYSSYGYAGYYNTYC